MSVSAGSILSIDGEISDASWCCSTDILEIDLECDLDGSNIEIEFVESYELVH